MKTKSKRSISILLTLLMLFSVIVFSSVNVCAVSVIDSAVNWAIEIANDNSHGYSQLQNRRWGNPDYDCSSFVITAFRNAGCNVGKATYTGDMKNVFVNAGFTWIPKSQINLSNSSQLVKGDILLREGHHTELYIGDNKRVGAHTGTYDKYDRNSPGDNNGEEICVYNYSNSNNWDGVLRYSQNIPVPVITPDPIPQPEPHNPIGVTDACEGSTGYVHVRGWAFDPDNTSASIMVHVYIGGVVGDPNAEGHAITANHGGRDDVNQAYNCGDNHAFYENITTDKTGTQEVHLYAINIDSGESVSIGDFTVNISPSPTVAVEPIQSSHNPIGVTDACEGGTGIVHVRGWAFDPDNIDYNIFVHVYIGGVVGDPNAEAHAITAALGGRYDVDNTYHCGDNHAFYENISTNKVGIQEVHLYAINIDSGESVPIGDFTVNIIDKNAGIVIEQIPNDYFNSTIDKVEVIDGNKLHIVGWTFAKLTPADTALCDVYIGGQLGSSDVIEAQRCLADVKRTDVYNAFKSEYSNLSDRHGIDYTFTMSTRGTYTLYIYAVDQTGKVPVNPQIAKVYNVTFSDPIPTEVPTQPPTQPPTEYTEPPTESNTYSLGDVDDDGEVGVIDATYIQRYDAGFNIPFSDEEILLRGDVDGDGEVGVIDATLVQRYNAGFRVAYPIGEPI